MRAAHNDGRPPGREAPEAFHNSDQLCGAITPKHTSSACGNQAARDRFLRDRRRERQVEHLHRCGARVCLEALLAMERGERLDDVLADITRLSPAAFRLTGADRMPSMPRVPITVIDGGAA